MAIGFLEEISSWSFFSSFDRVWKMASFQKDFPKKNEWFKQTFYSSY